MKNMLNNLQGALQERRLTTVTKALSELAERLAYQLRLPYTEVLHFIAREADDRYAIEFAAKLHLHYSSLERQNEGLVFTLEFEGDAYADSPNPSLHELFYAAVVNSVSSCAYGTGWQGKSIPTPPEFAENLEVRSQTLLLVELKDLLGRIAEKG
jgi:hypothetical protein